MRFSKRRPNYVPGIPLFGNVPLAVDRALNIYIFELCDFTIEYIIRIITLYRAAALASTCPRGAR